MAESAGGAEGLSVNEPFVENNIGQSQNKPEFRSVDGDGDLTEYGEQSRRKVKVQSAPLPGKGYGRPPNMSSRKGHQLLAEPSPASAESPCRLPTPPQISSEESVVSSGLNEQPTIVSTNLTCKKTVGAFGVSTIKSQNKPESRPVHSDGDMSWKTMVEKMETVIYLRSDSEQPRKKIISQSRPVQGKSNERTENVSSRKRHQELAKTLLTSTEHPLHLTDNLRTIIYEPSNPSSNSPNKLHKKRKWLQELSYDKQSITSSNKEKSNEELQNRFGKSLCGQSKSLKPSDKQAKTYTDEGSWKSWRASYFNELKSTADKPTKLLGASCLKEPPAKPSKTLTRKMPVVSLEASGLNEHPTKVSTELTSEEPIGVSTLIEQPVIYPETLTGEKQVKSFGPNSEQPAKSLRTLTDEEPVKPLGASTLNEQQPLNYKKQLVILGSMSCENSSNSSVTPSITVLPFQSSSNKDDGNTGATGFQVAKDKKKEKFNTERKLESENLLKNDQPNLQMANLYLRVNQHLNPENDVKKFLQERTGEALRFTVLEKAIVGVGTELTLQFPRKNQAKKASNLLKESNQKFKTKLFCSLVKEEVFVISLERDEVEFKKEFDKILKRAKKTMYNHEEKIKEITMEIESLSMNKKDSRRKCEQRRNEKEALRSKLEELTEQQKQFASFLDNFNEKMKHTWTENTYAQHVSDFRRDLRVECGHLEKALPIYTQRKEILTVVEENQVSVILGETGCGKSTQMTQYLHQAGYSQSGIIVCTQPRKVAAMSLATHVASELATSVGNVVGYKIEMRSKTSGVTKILYMTDHCLLNECLKDPSLSVYSCVIVDEAHERSMYTDLLLGMLKICLNQRPELKAIITSATIDPDVFVRYFGACPVHRVPGRMFPVEVVYRGAYEGEMSYIDSALIKVEKVHKEEPPGDVLVFVTSPLETEQCSEKLKARMQGRTDFKCLIIHEQLQPEKQEMVFQPCAAGIRKIVFATSSAETSITIPGIKYVIDTGFVKEKRYDPKRNMSSLSVVVISKNSADQRKGRAGRTGPGKCYRLYNEDLFKEMDAVAQPEILKVHLGQAILQLLELGINPLQYDFIQSPSETAIKATVETLEELGAVKDNKITDEGREMAKLPVEPRLGLIIQKGRAQGALFDAIVLAAISSMGSSVFFRGGSDDDKKKADKLKIQFCQKGGDSLTLMEVYRKWSKQPEKKKISWCFENSINSKTIRTVRDTVNEITTIMEKDFKLKIVKVFQEPEVVDEKLQKILFECHVSNLCHYLGHVKAGYTIVKSDQQVHQHPSSVLNHFNLQPEWIVFEQSLKTSRDFIKGLTPVKEHWVVEAIESGTLKKGPDELRNKRRVADYVGLSDFRRDLREECYHLEKALPIYTQRKEILTVIDENQVSVILGETGCGKSTQMTQYLYQAGYSQSGIIVCTQPRKVAAISLATHVASELATSVGNVVGYKVGMRAKTSGVTKILYMTDHCLLNECLKDPSLSAYSCVIVDEAHERSIYTDLLLGMLKICLNQRPELKAIITSATIDPDVFVRYFEACPVLRVSGRMFPVEVVYQGADEGEKSYIDSALIKVEEVHKEEPPGEVLVFVTSPLETEQCSEKLKARMQGRTDFKCLILHGQLQPEEQEMVFQPCAAGIRKIVFATNSAETSITIPGIKYVIDTGFVKEKRYDPRRNMNSLSVVVISKSSADQRKGRAGRTGPGKCYRLYNEDLYKDMDTVAQPEILKVHLGQAILQLLELGKKPTQYDFIQSPSETAIKAAIETLEELGAVKDNKITDEGREMAKLPVEPRLGLIIQKGRAQGALFDAIVLAAISSMGSSVFFRGGSDDDKKKADKLKIQFCQKGGDSLTLMEVYRKWSKQPEKKKKSWCFENSISSMSIQTVRDTVNEITTIMEKDFKMKIVKVLQEPEVVDEKLQKILFECHVSNICHYLGHVKAGYAIVKTDQQVHQHPSSVLNDLNLQPEWIVFEQLLKTSRDFITGLTPVKEHWVVEAIESGTLKQGLDELRNKRLVADYVGLNIFKDFSGPQYTKLRAFGDEASEIAKPIIEHMVLPFDRDADTQGKSSNPIVLKAQLSMIDEDLEVPVNLKDESAGIRVVLGTGGKVKDILMPEEFRTVLVDKPSETSSEDTIITKFSKFGDVKDHKIFKHPQKSWGSVTFESASDAALAVKATKEDKYEIAIPERVGRLYQNSDFRAKITWCRRESKGFGFVDVARKDLLRILRLRVINVEGYLVKFDLERKNGKNIFLGHFGKDVNEDDIKYAFSKLVQNVNLERVTVIREKVDQNEEDMKEIGKELMENIEESVPKERYHLDLKYPNPGTVMHHAFVTFKNADEGIAACQRMSQKACIQDKVVTMEPQIQSTMYIHPEVYVAVSKDVDSYLKEHQDCDLSDVEITSKSLSNGTVILNFESSNTVELAKVRARLQEILQGDVLDLEANPHLHYFFNRSGQHFLKDVVKKFDVYIQADYRNLTISIRGKQPSVTMAQSQLIEYLNSIGNEDWKEINIRGNAMPKGMMKTLMKKYGLELEKLQQRTGLKSLTLNFNQQMVKMIGSAEAIDKTVAVIDEVCASLQEETEKETGKYMPVCGICFCTIEDEQLYWLEYCRHGYCIDCLKLQVEFHLKTRLIPISCVKQDCGEPFVLRDLTFLSGQGSLTMNSIVQSSVSSYVIANSKNIKYCLTPDCNMVYKVTTTGAVFRCPECNIKICTSCHTQCHEGLTCAMFKSAKEDEGNLDVYLASRTNTKKCPRREKEDKFDDYLRPNMDTKKCPKCKTAIKKDGGCNIMFCQVCKWTLCWICLARFKSRRACNSHMNAKHGDNF